MQRKGSNIARPLRRWVLAVSLLGTVAIHSPAYAQKKGKDKLVDTCLPYRKPFEQIKDYQLKKILGGAAKGALLGAGLQILQNAVTNEYERDQYGRVLTDAKGKPIKKGGSVLRAAIAGAAVGGLVGWFESKKKVARNQEELQAAVASSFSQDVEQFSPLAQRLADLGNCRRAQIFSVQVAYEGQQIDAKTAAGRLTSIEGWLKKDDEVISKAAKMQTKAVGAYVRATAMADGQDPATAENQEDAILATFETQGATYEPAVYETYIDVAGSEIELPPPPPITETRYISAAKGANVRAQPQKDAPVVKLLANGTPVETLPAPVQGWRSVRADGVEGFASETVLSLAPPRGRPAVAPKPAPVVRKPPEKAAKKLHLRQPARQPVVVRDRASFAAANRVSFNRMVTQNSQATSDQLRAARVALES